MFKLVSFFDELEKIAVSTRVSSFTQTRVGRRPIRAHNLLKKDRTFKVEPELKPAVLDGEIANARDYESERGSGMMEGEVR
jgi:hypothetical protein